MKSVLVLTAENEVAATRGLELLPPWEIRASKKYAGRLYFYNYETKESEWILPRSKFLAIVDSKSSTNPQIDNHNNICLAQRDSTKRTLGETESFSTAQASHHENHQRSPSTSIWGWCGSLSRPSPSNQCSLPSLSRAKTANDSTTQTSSSSNTSYLSSMVSGNSSLSSNSSMQRQEQNQAAAAATNDDQYEKEDMLLKVVGGLGVGGYSVVVKAQNIRNGKCFAMKVINKTKCVSGSAQQKYEQRLRIELLVLTRINPSPFVQRCHHAFESPSSVFFILDLNSGGDLFYHLVKRIGQNGFSFTETEAQILLAEIYLGLEHLHKHNIMHRDIKIENIMLDAQGHVKLVDFGLALEMKSEVQEIGIAGSLFYIAPEVLRNRLGGRFTDWWAFGILAHELLTGKIPWSSLTDTKLVKWEIVNRTVLPPTNLSEEAVVFVCSLLRHDVMSRLGTHNDDEIRSCSFFKSIDWEAMSRLELPPAFVPNRDIVNIAQEDQNNAMQKYRKTMKLDGGGGGGGKEEEAGSHWMIGLPDYSKFLLL